MDERLVMTVKLNVTPAQALTLQAMFEHWNLLAGIGASRMIGFFVDGDGNFKPHCEWEYSEKIPPLTDELRNVAAVSVDDNYTKNFDFDGVAWAMRSPIES